MFLQVQYKSKKNKLISWEKNKCIPYSLNKVYNIHPLIFQFIAVRSVLLGFSP